ARRADGAGAMLLELLPERSGIADRLLIERWHVRRRRWRRAPKYILEHIFSPDHRRRARRITGYRKHAGVAQDSSALAFSELDTPELRSIYAFDAVMFRQP